MGGSPQTEFQKLSLPDKNQYLLENSPTFAKMTPKDRSDYLNEVHSPTFQLEDVVGHPEFQGLSLPEKNDFLMKHVPEFSGYAPKSRSEFLNTVHYGPALKGPGQIDYDELARRHGAKPVDYDALAAQHGAQPQGEFTNIRPIDEFTNIRPIDQAAQPPGPPAEPPGLASRVWQAANEPAGPARGTRDFAEKVRSGISSMAGLHLPPRIAAPVAYGANLATAIPASMVEFGRRMLTPLTLATAGAGGEISALRAAPRVPGAVRAGLGAVETLGGGAFGAQGVKAAVTPKAEEETGLQEFERRVGGAGQAILGGVAAGQGVKEGLGKATEPVRGRMATRIAQSLLGPEPKGTPPVSSPARALVAEGPLALSRKGGILTRGLIGNLDKSLAAHEATIQRTLRASKGAPPEPLEPIVRNAVKPLMDEARDLGHPEIADRIQSWAERYLAEHPPEVTLDELHNLRKRMGSNQPLFQGTSEEFSDLKTAKQEVYRAMNRALDRRMPGFSDVTERQSGLIRAKQMLKEQARREAGGPLLPSPRLYGGVSGGGGDFGALRIGLPVPFETLGKTLAIKALGTRVPLGEPTPARPFVAPPPPLTPQLGPPEPGAVTPPRVLPPIRTYAEAHPEEARLTPAPLPPEATAPVPPSKPPTLHAESAELAGVKEIKRLISSGRADQLTPGHLRWLQRQGVNIEEAGAVAAALKAANSRLAELAGTAKGKPAQVARGPAPSLLTAPRVAPPPGAEVALPGPGVIENAAVQPLPAPVSPLPRPAIVAPVGSPPPEPGATLPGLGQAVLENRAAAGRFQGQELGREFNAPRENISATTGEIERESPLFRETAASGQEGLFRKAEAARPATAAPTAIPEATKPGEGAALGPVLNVPRETIIADPQRFQFRTELSRAMRAAIETGDARFKPELSEGPVTFWKDPADGKSYVVDGHHRLEIARRSGTTEIEARELNAPNVQTARAFGAYRNIASGHASAIDVAKFMRDTGIGPDHLAQQGISLGSKLVSDGSRLANLDDSIFDQVVTGKLPERTGAAIAQIADKTAQRGMLELLKRKQANGGGLNYAEIEALARRATLAGRTETTGGLFGPTSESNAVDAARVEAYVRTRLSSDKRLFGFVSKGERPAELSRAGNVINVSESKGIAENAAKVLGVFDRLVSYEGPINDAINEAAGAIKSGKSPQAARETAYQRIQESVAEELGQTQ